MIDVKGLRRYGIDVLMGFVYPSQAHLVIRAVQSTKFISQRKSYAPCFCIETRYQISNLLTIVNVVSWSPRFLKTSAPHVPYL